MKKYFTLCLPLLILVVSLLTPSCKTLVWDPIGIWEFTITFLDTDDLPGQYTFDFQDEIGGRADGFEVPSIYFTYTKTGDFSIDIVTFVSTIPISHYQMTCYSSESDPDRMTGTGTKTISTGPVTNLQISAVKKTNLQD